MRNRIKIYLPISLVSYIFAAFCTYFSMWQLTMASLVEKCLFILQKIPDTNGFNLCV